MPTDTYTLTHWGTYRTKASDGRPPEIHALPDDPAPSPIGQSMQDTLNDSARITQPMVRAGYLTDGPASRASRGSDPFVPVDWDTATKLVAQEFERVRGQYGNRAIFGGSYGWASAGRFHHTQSQLHRFLNVAGGYVSSVNTYSHAAAEVMIPHILGSTKGLNSHHTPWSVMCGNTELFVAFGGLPERNTQISAGGVGHHNVPMWLDKCRATGTHFVNIGPLRSDIAPRLQPEWLSALPGSDTALMLGLAHSLHVEGLSDPAFLATHASGFDRFAAYLMGETDGTPKSAEWAGDLCGIDPETIRALARRMAASRTMISVALSLQRAEHGEQPIWMAITLAAMLGQIGLPGGGFGVGYGATNRIGELEPGISWPALSQFTNPVPDFIPVARLADMLLNPGQPFAYNGQDLTYPHIRLVWWAGGNPFHHSQDLNKLVRAFRQPETVIVQDPWWTATARHADIVLPATTSLERNDLGIAKSEPHLVAMRQVAQPHAQVRNDYDILSDVARHIGLLDAFTEGRSEMDWVRHLYEGTQQSAAKTGVNLPDFDTFWQTGLVRFTNPAHPQPLLADFRADPVVHRLPTPSGKIEIYSETVAGFGYADCPGHAFWIAPQEWLGAKARAPQMLHLISNQPATRLHGQLDNGALSRASKINGREPATFNPADAAARGIKPGDTVRLFNARGACLAGACLSEDVAPGIVQLATGAWFNPEVPGQDNALDLHGNPNILTRDVGTSQLAQGPISHSALVEAQRIDTPMPSPTAFDAPDIQTTSN
ncbi:molybdopterin-dependent oxidoreductase [Roseovarius aestuarii]|nr:molybdopterin-dependent oxidoreductase [Roseovarius aestuarii]